MSSNSIKILPDTSLEYRDEIVIGNETMILVPCGLMDYQKIKELANTYQSVRNPFKQRERKNRKVGSVDMSELSISVQPIRRHNCEE